MSAMMMSALKITALKIALPGLCRRMMFSGAMTGNVAMSIAGMMAKYFATSLAMLNVVSAPRVMSSCFPISIISKSFVGFESRSTMLPASLAAALITLLTQHDRKLSAGLSIGAVVAGFVLSLIFVKLNGWGPARESSVAWLAIGDLQVDFGLRFDPLSLLMLLLVTGVASAIHIYSWGYMS